MVSPRYRSRGHGSVKTLYELLKGFTQGINVDTVRGHLALLTMDNGYTSRELLRDLAGAKCAGVGVLGKRGKSAFDVVTYLPSADCDVANEDPAELLGARRTFQGKTKVVDGNYLGQMGVRVAVSHDAIPGMPLVEVAVRDKSKSGSKLHTNVYRFLTTAWTPEEASANANRLLFVRHNRIRVSRETHGLHFDDMFQAEQSGEATAGTGAATDSAGLGRVVDDSSSSDEEESDLDGEAEGDNEDQLSEDDDGDVYLSRGGHYHQRTAPSGRSDDITPGQEEEHGTRLEVEWGAEPPLDAARWYTAPPTPAEEMEAFVAAHAAPVVADGQPEPPATKPPTDEALETFTKTTALQQVCAVVAADVVVVGVIAACEERLHQATWAGGKHSHACTWSHALRKSKLRLHSWSTPMTVGQLGQEWHAARKFTITGTAAAQFPNRLVAITAADARAAAAAANVRDAAPGSDALASAQADKAEAEAALKTAHKKFWKGELRVVLLRCRTSWFSCRVRTNLRHMCVCACVCAVAEKSWFDCKARSTQPMQLGRVRAASLLVNCACTRYTHQQA